MPHFCSRLFSTPALLCLVFLSLTACGGQRSAPIREGTPPIQQGMVKDLQTFPQDLAFYAKNTGEDTNLLSPMQQMEQDARFNRIYFGPWSMSRATMKPAAFRKTFGKARGYKGTTRWTKEEWEAIKQNAAIAAYPSRKSPAITVRQTNLRELPTSQARYSEPTPDPLANPFDYFQYSALGPGMPLFVTHASKDKMWFFVETPIAAGWVRSADVATVDSSFIKRYKNDRYAAIIRDKVNLTSERGEALGRAHIGAIFPVAASMGDNLLVFLPVRDVNGMATITRALLQDGEAVIKPIPALPKLMAVIGNEMMAQPYGWGGMYENRDCSSTMRDLFTPFGIWLPRNSAAQYRAGQMTPLQGLSPSSKENTILSSGVPFMTLLWMRGHVGLYVGKHKGKAAFYHNVWGVRVDEQGQGDDRHVIGRCVVTSLEPGKELRNAVKDKTILHRIGGMSTLPSSR